MSTEVLSVLTPFEHILSLVLHEKLFLHSEHTEREYF